MSTLDKCLDSSPAETLILFRANYVVAAYLVKQSPVADREQLSCSFTIPVGVLECAEDCLGLGLRNAAAEGWNLPHPVAFSPSP